MNAEQGPEIESEEQDRGEANAGPERSRRGRRRRHGMVWEFFHPPAASWSAPGEKSARSRAERLSQKMDDSARLRALVALGTLVLVALLALSGWAVTRPSDDAETAPSPGASEETSRRETAESLPGAAGGSAPGAAPEEEEKQPRGEEADEAALKAINEGEGLVTARAEDADDPMVTGARFLRALRSTDTTSDSVEDWYAARDSFLLEAQTGAQEDWGAAGEQEAVSSAEVSWAEMDAAIVDGRGIAPDFEFGPEAEPGTHLVQVGMRLEREITVDGEVVQEPSGALMEAVVVCPPAEGVDRCVVTRWAEEPAGFTASMDDSWVVFR